MVRPLVEPSFSRTIYLATVRGRPHSPAVGAFVQEARRYPWPATTNGSLTGAAIALRQQIVAVRKAFSAAGKPAVDRRLHQDLDDLLRSTAEIERRRDMDPKLRARRDRASASAAIAAISRVRRSSASRA